ncbi:aminotransferase class V-fold PLP-dependent enzyme [Saccharothrix obliqua]|uniref:aminotransferase class V-fold PLP-dependent enzyme n=1 Tax=Saccharothrix obliqua TaxID=2861747 RepID=UPI001C5D2359|nr:cysteine desulfurase [Saccharothrix obliqua]MBW4718728.1 cysteine desulfurase [Saccharothrix obliqua]
MSTPTVSDLTALRADFPTIRPDEVFLDSVASSLTPRSVVDAMTSYYLNDRANIHRGTYDLSMRASEKFDAAVASVAGFIGALPQEIVLTSNTTHSINLVAHTLDFQPGDEIVLTSLEHTSNMAPWVRMAQEKDLQLRWYNAGRTGHVDADELIKLIGPRTKLVTCTAVSNVLGTMPPIAAIGRACRERGVLFLVDAAQAAPHLPLDVVELNCDFLAFSGHKMLGPTGIGVLYIRMDLATSLMPGMIGGGTLDTSACDCPSLEECSLDYCSYSELPDKWQAGTPPIAEAYGLHAAIEYLRGVGFDRIAAHDRALMDRLVDGLRSVKGIDIYGPEDNADRLAIVSFNIGDLHPDEVGRILNERYHIGVRTGQHCAVNYFNEVNGHAGSPGNVRAGVYLYNTAEEVDRTVRAVDEIATTLLR